MRVCRVMPSRQAPTSIPDARRMPPADVPEWLPRVPAPPLVVAGDDGDVTGCGSSVCVAGRIAGARRDGQAGGRHPVSFRASPA
ncbi:hypothetical protein C6P77_25065 [Burkholderia ambifaria]|nr:hypothetical protein C6P77_25065 [Burkholderia ambifaria]